MKPKNLMLFLTLILGLSIANKSGFAQADFDDKQAMSMLKEFYTRYITTISNDPIDKTPALQIRYCTSKLLKILPVIMEQTDADPFLKAQDSDLRFLKSLSVKKLNKKPHTYEVSYIAEQKITIVLTVIKKKGTYKIDALQ